MDLTTGAREFHDLEDDREDEIADEAYKSMTLAGKVKYQLANW